MSNPKRAMRLGLSLPGAGCHPAGSEADGDSGFRHLARCATISEESKLDFILLRGVAGISYGGHPRMEPLTLAAALAAVTRNIGLVTTASTSLHHPFALARRLASIDHLSRGRAGWDLVTTATPDEQLNHSLHGAFDYANRYECAREFLAVVQGLFDGWEPGAFLRDQATGVYMDPAKMHRLHHAGPCFKIRGPSDVDRPPQGALPIISEATLDDDRDFAAEVADMVFIRQPSIEDARAHYRSIKARLAHHGRTPESLLVMPCIMPTIGRTQAAAEDLFATMHDAPEADAVSRATVPLGIVGTPTLIADTMEEWCATDAADGFIIQWPHLSGQLEDFAHTVIPELQRRGLFRIEYEASTLRGNLGMTPVAAWKDFSAQSVRFPAI
jgi:FMN-dependent oxidoreductase (nitrilotriacetate monooxygenase family)